MMNNTRISLCALLIVLSVAAVSVIGAAPDPNNPTGTSGLIMIDKRGGYVRFFDPATLKEVSSLQTEAPPHELAISADHRTAYVPLYGDGVYGNNPNPGHKIVVIDLTTRKISSTIDVSPYLAPHGLQVDNNGLLYASCDSSRKLLVIDPKSGKTLAAIDTDGTGHWAAVLPDGSKAYVANKNDRMFVSIIDLKARKMIGRVPMPKGTQGITASPDGKRVIAIDFTDPKFYVIDTATDKIVDTVTVDRNTIGPFRARYSPDGATLMTVNHMNALANIFDAKNLHASQKTLTVGQQAFGIAFSADGKTALVSNHGDGTISVIDMTKSQVSKTFTAGTGIETLAYY
ncbi:MAG TPA: cytochrome D1 domain-containing protein [Terriglobia bacterium]|nr:cytochrome D1 domain-containing protein [Terriglobia bacterium]